MFALLALSEMKEVKSYSCRVFRQTLKTVSLMVCNERVDALTTVLRTSGYVVWSGEERERYTHPNTNYTVEIPLWRFLPVATREVQCEELLVRHRP